MSNGAGLVGNGCVFDGALAGHVGRRHRPLLDRPHRLAGDAIEHVDEGLLGDLRDRLDALAVDGDVDQVGRGRQVVVPQAVMDDLEVPDPLAGRHVEADEAFAEEVVARDDGRRRSRWSAC